jgi:hypothetical protein
MAMGTTMIVATGLAALNVTLLLVLTGVWVRNYRTFGSELTLGLLAFAVVLLLENLTAVYFFLSTEMLYAKLPEVQTAVLTLRALQFVALAFLTWVTLK